MQHDTPSIETLLGHVEWARALARRLVGDTPEAEDVVQDTFAAALRRPPVANRAVRPWLGTVLGNVVRERSRRRGRRAGREADAAGVEAPSSTDELTERAELQRLLIDELMRLDAERRDVVLLRYFEGLASPAIARRLGVPAGTVRWRLKQAIDALREALDRRFGDDRHAWVVAFAPLVGARSTEAAGATGAFGSVAATWLVAGGVTAAIVVALAATSVLPLVPSGGAAHEVVQVRPPEPATTARVGETAAGATAATTDDGGPSVPKFGGPTTSPARTPSSRNSPFGLADEDGRFRIVTRSGDAIDLEASDVMDELSPARLGNVEPGTTGLVLRLAPRRMLLVRLVDPDGTSLEGGTVAALDAESGRRLGTAAEATDAPGTSTATP